MTTLQRRTKLGLLALAFTMALVFAPSEKRSVYADVIGAGGDEDITVTGCLVAGNGDGKGFLLTNVLPASIDMSTRAAQGQQTSGTSGTLPGASTVIYWLDDLEDDDSLADYAGRRVEVRGEVEGDIDRGGMEIERDGDWVEIEITSDGRKVETRLPWASVMPNDGKAVGTSGTLKEGQEIELNINVRKIDVKDVRVVAGSCR
ncbi:MAG: hypothetical protein HYU53_14695 [Acidobacteria bacterium]|nr:hypothetical protein [Acidobacteriota bacterium]